MLFYYRLSNFKQKHWTLCTPGRFHPQISLSTTKRRGVTLLQRGTLQGLCPSGPTDPDSARGLHSSRPVRVPNAAPHCRRRASEETKGALSFQIRILLTDGFTPLVIILITKYSRDQTQHHSYIIRFYKVVTRCCFSVQISRLPSNHNDALPMFSGNNLSNGIC